MPDLNTIWFVLLFVLLTGYAILDGFDLGVGMLHLTGKTDGERRLGLNAIGPVWDGNEVWLLTGGGALFAAFPFVYATVFSAMYLALMLVLAGLIGRAVALEFRSKVESTTWRGFWDVVFCVSSALPSLLFGVALGNVLRGLPISPDAAGHLRFTGGFFGLLNPFSLLTGMLSLVLFLQQGAAFMACKSEGGQKQRMQRLLPVFWGLAVLLYFAASVIAATSYPHLVAGATAKPLFWVFLALTVAGAILVVSSNRAGAAGRAFVASSAMVAGMMATAAVYLFPRLVPSTADLAHSLTIYNSSSSPQSLRVMFVIALIGMPLVILYTVLIYRVFKGKTVVREDGY